MLADLDLLLISVYCRVDDLLPRRKSNARGTVTDAEVVTLCVAQSLMGLPSDERFLKAARKRLLHLFPRLPGRSGFHKRRQRLADTIEAMIEEFASDSPGYHDNLVLVDSTPVETDGGRTSRAHRVAGGSLPCSGMAAQCPHCSSRCEYDNNGKLRCVDCGKTVKH